MLRHWLQSSQSFFHSQALKQNDEMKKKWLEICERDWKSRRSAKIINAKEVVKKTGAKKKGIEGKKSKNQTSIKIYEKRIIHNLVNKKSFDKTEIRELNA